ncbi:hypothetical protein X975_17459, partial [Stegodyphus mimosarum]
MEDLILEIQNYPCIYATDAEDYRDNMKKAVCWETIATRLNRSSAELKREWKNARDCYRQALSIRKNRNNMKPWRYEKIMEFVKPYLKPKRNTEEIAFYGDCFETIDDVIIKSEVTTDFEDELSESDYISENPPNEESPASPQRTSKRKRHSSDNDIQPIISRVESSDEKTYQQKHLELQQSREISTPSRDLESQNKIITFASKEPNDLELFFASICETAKALPRKYQNKIKREVLEIVTKAEEDCETETILP